MYRQEALDNLQTVEQTDALLLVTTFPLWVALGIAGSVLAVIALWGIFGEITTMVQAEGVLNRQVEIFVTTEERHQIEAGMTAHVLPEGLSPEEYGYLVGEVISVANTPINQQFRVIINLKQPYEWTAATNPPFDVATTLPVQVNIIVKKERPISRLLP
jgi:hypothetical protein